MWKKLMSDPAHNEVFQVAKVRTSLQIETEATKELVQFNIWCIATASCIKSLCHNYQPINYLPNSAISMN